MESVKRCRVQTRTSGLVIKKSIFKAKYELPMRVAPPTRVQVRHPDVQPQRGTSLMYSLFGQSFLEFDHSLHYSCWIVQVIAKRSFQEKTSRRNHSPFLYRRLITLQQRHPAMASPAPSQDSQASAKPQEQISFRFCREWSVLFSHTSHPSLSSPIPTQSNLTTLTPPRLVEPHSSNMLYPKEDRLTSKLMFACRTCQFSEEAQSSCVFRNNMYNTVGETAGVTQDVGSDPTVSWGLVSSGLMRVMLCVALVSWDEQGR